MATSSSIMATDPALGVITVNVTPAAPAGFIVVRTPGAPPEAPPEAKKPLLEEVRCDWSETSSCGDLFYNANVGGRPKYVYLAEEEAKNACATFQQPPRADEDDHMLKHRQTVYECNVDQLQLMVSFIN